MNQASVVNAKPFYQSKTLWLNVAGAALIALEAQWSVLQPYLPGNVYSYIATFLTVANAVLRVVTAAPLAFGVKQDDAA